MSKSFLYLCVFSLSSVVRPCLWTLSCLCWSVSQRTLYGASACTSSVPPEGGSTKAALKSCWTDVPRPSLLTPITTYKTKTWSVVSVTWTFSPLYDDFSWSDCFPLCVTFAGVVVAEASPWTLWQDESSSRQQHPVSCPQRYGSPWTLTSQMMTWNSFVESHLWFASGDHWPEWKMCLLEFKQERNLDKDRIFNSS